MNYGIARQMEYCIAIRYLAFEEYVRGWEIVTCSVKIKKQNTKNMQ